VTVSAARVTVRQTLNDTDGKLVLFYVVEIAVHVYVLVKKLGLDWDFELLRLRISAYIWDLDLGHGI